MPVEDNKQAVQRFYQEVINSRNLDALDELLTPMGSITPSAARTPSRPSSSSAWSTRPSPTCTSTHQGEFLGIPATGKQTTTSGVDFFRMQDGRQVEHWGGPDMFSFLIQLGVMPGPGTPGPGTTAYGPEWGTAALSGVGRQRSGAAVPGCCAKAVLSGRVQP